MRLDAVDDSIRPFIAGAQLRKIECSEDLALSEGNLPSEVYVVRSFLGFDKVN